MKIEALYEIFLQYGKISTDSRAVSEKSIFFSLKGANFNGNEFAEDALNKGAAVCILDDEKYYNPNNPKFIFVDDCLKTLQELATFHRSKFTFPVLGITGTNGKTTTKELIAGVLALKYRVKATSGNLNNDIGVPLSVLSVDIKNTDFCVIEMGANHIGEIAFLCEIAKPNYGLITSIGKAHLEGFGSFENIIKTKLELYNFIERTNGTVFADADNEILVKNLANINAMYYGVENNDKLSCFGKLDTGAVNLSFDWQTKNRKEVFHVDSKMYGKYNFINMLAAACVGTYFDVPEEDITNYLSNFLSDNNRSQIITIGSNTIICDAYNANPSSMEVALDTFDEIKAEGKMMIIGDMFELGKDSEKEHQKILDKIDKMNVERVILVGKTYSKLNSKYESYLTIDDAVLNIKIPNLSKTILIKGSRSMKLEKIINTNFSIS